MFLFFFLRKVDLETPRYNCSKQTLQIRHLRGRDNDHTPLDRILQLFFDLSEQSRMSSDIIPLISANNLSKTRVPARIIALGIRSPCSFSRAT